MMHQDTPHSVQDRAGQRYPVIDGIPFFRNNRDDLRTEALARLDADDKAGALVVLLSDQDDWWRGSTADTHALRELVVNHTSLTLRHAMQLLAWGPVADYFSQRWSDPTYLAGLALIEAHWTTPRHVFELACGIGHHLRALSRLGVATTGTDVVFAKLWLARHWIVPKARLLCQDASQPVQLTKHFDLVTCHDAFYFLEPKSDIIDRLRALMHPTRGLLAISHVHNSQADNFSAGAAIAVDDFAALLPDALLYDDAELTRALAESRAPRAESAAELRAVEAVGAVAGPALQAPSAIGDLLAVPPDGARLRRNPLYDQEGRLRWPSERYAQEYAARVTYPVSSNLPEWVTVDAASRHAARCRELVDLPVRW